MEPVGGPRGPGWSRGLEPGAWSLALLLQAAQA